MGAELRATNGNCLTSAVLTPRALRERQVALRLHSGRWFQGVEPPLQLERAATTGRSRIRRGVLTFSREDFTFDKAHHGVTRVWPMECYEGHFRKRATISGEYQGRSGLMLRVMQSGKNWAQYSFFSASVLA
jgi:hypothetical protein